MTIRQNVFIILLIGGLICAVTPSAVQGQPPAAADTLGVTRVIQNLKPKYNTTYQVTRQSRKWNQGLDFVWKNNLWTLNSATKYDISSDIFQDRSHRRGSQQIGLQNINMLGLPFGFNINYARNLTDSRDYRDSKNLRLNGNTRYSYRTMGIRHGFTLKGDLNTSKDENFNAVLGNASILKRNNRSGDFGWTMNWNSGEIVQLSSNFVHGRKGGEATSGDKVDPTGGENTNINVSLGYSPYAWLPFRVSYSRGNKTDITTQQSGGLDTRVAEENFNNNINGGVTVRGLGWEADWSMGTRDARQVYDPESDEPVFDHFITRSVASEGYDWKGSLKGRAFGADLEGSLLERSTDTKQGARNPLLIIPRNNVARTFESKIRRKITADSDITMRLDLDLQRQVDVVSDPTFSNDFDELKRLFDVSGNWRPARKWTLGMGFLYTTIDRTELNPDKAGNTRTEVNGAISTVIGYRLSERVSLRQTYNIRSTFREFLFQASKNSNLIDRRINTIIDFALNPRLKFLFNYQWVRQNKGSLEKTESGNIVRPESRDYTQDLDTEVIWDPMAGLRLFSRQAFSRKDNVLELTGVSKMGRRTLQLRQGMEFRRQLGRGFNVSAMAEHTRSNTGESYWTINSNLTKDF